METLSGKAAPERVDLLRKGLEWKTPRSFWNYPPRDICNCDMLN